MSLPRLKHIALLICTAIAVADMMADDFSDAGHPKGACADRGRAEEWLSTLPLEPVEGIWEYPADDTALLIVADPGEKGRLGIYYLEGTDCRLYPGMRIGQLTRSSSERKFKISLCSTFRKGIPGDPRPGLATLSEREDALYIDMPDLKININPSIILPILWNKLRLNLRMRSVDPLDNLPEGWIKTFPSIDANGSLAGHPRYL